MRKGHKQTQLVCAPKPIGLCSITSVLLKQWVSTLAAITLKILMSGSSDLTLSFNCFKLWFGHQPIPRLGTIVLDLVAHQNHLGSIHEHNLYRP